MAPAEEAVLIIGVYAGEGVGLEDLAVSNADRPIREVALEIIAWLGWT